MANFNTHFSDFMSYAEKEKGYSAHTVKSYSNDLRRLDQFMKSYTNDPDWTVAGIDRQTIRHFLGKEFEEGFASRTVARRLATLKSFCKYLHTNGILEVNHAAEVKTPKTPKTLPVFIISIYCRVFLWAIPITMRGTLRAFGRSDAHQGSRVCAKR